ncbi:hypothetical protein BTW08_08890 [Salinicola sp. MH3R3-1]|uniref:GntR family transcriptional regulator n=1 Tax=Salinicola sp. MH3R3-1 TaxID=1928762 RepID=UPI00094EAA32|nr:GntR family transcriptional regulator [Salinicola sp. MH3R3-1]OLO08005.1 hypothetical protein BTW08_08890 [Salinicola sp. MH3R3-1]
MTLETIVEACLPHFENERLGVPKYARFYNAIRDAIESGRLVAGDKLPSEQELSSRLPASLGTLQRGLKALADDGIIVRQHGRGTFIRDQELRYEEIRVFRFLDQGRPLPLTLQGVGVRRVDIDGEIAKFFERDECVVIERLVQVENEPWTFNAFYLPLKLAEELLEMAPADFDGFSIHEYLHRSRQLLTTRFDHHLNVGEFSNAARRALNLDDQTTAGMQWRVHGYTREGKPATFQCFELQPGHRPIELKTQLDR